MQSHRHRPASAPLISVLLLGMGLLPGSAKATACGVSQVDLAPTNPVGQNSATRYRFDSLNRLRSLQEGLNATRWIARDIAGRAQAETTLNWLGSVQSARIHHNDGYRRIATDQVSGSKRFLYGRGLDELLFQEKGGAQLSPVVSQLGSTMKLLGANGSVADQFRYDAFGAPLTGDSAGFSHLFAGAIYDSKAKLYDLRHRHYDPQIGRFLSRDPLGMHADGFNLGNAYAYVGNNPLNRRDPLGLLTDGEGFWGAVWKGFKKDLASTGRGLRNAGVNAYEGAKYLVTEEIPSLAIDAAVATGILPDHIGPFSIPTQSATVQTAQKYYDEAGGSVSQALLDATVDVGTGIVDAGKAYGNAILSGDVEYAAEVLGNALLGLGAAKAGTLASKMKNLKKPRTPHSSIPERAGLATAATSEAAPTPLAGLKKTTSKTEGPQGAKQCATTDGGNPSDEALRDGYGPVVATGSAADSGLLASYERLAEQIAGECSTHAQRIAQLAPDLSLDQARLVLDTSAAQDYLDIINYVSMRQDLGMPLSLDEVKDTIGALMDCKEGLHILRLKIDPSYR